MYLWDKMAKNTNKIIRLKLIKIYGKICMLGEEITKDNYITLHHLIKVCDNGKTNIENGSLLGRYMHQNLHNIIENYYFKEYKYINEYLKYYKATKDEEEKQRMNKYVKKLTRENNKARK